MRLALKASVLVLALTLSGAATAQVGANRAEAPRGTNVPDQPPDPAAIAALERMGAYLRSVQTFGVAGDITTEEVLETGQSVQYTGAIDLVAQRPGRLRANLDSSRKRRQYFYDGTNLTVWSPRQGYYATVPAPATIHEMIDMASTRLDLVIPFADLFEFGTNPALTQRLTAGFLVGTEAVEDQICTHYAFRQPNVDWEIWIREGEQPLPCKYRIVSLEDEARPAYNVVLTWNMAPVFTPDTFVFTPPEGADRIQIATTTASAQ